MGFVEKYGVTPRRSGHNANDEGHWQRCRPALFAASKFYFIGALSRKSSLAFTRCYFEYCLATMSDDIGTYSSYQRTEEDHSLAIISQSSFMHLPQLTADRWHLYRRRYWFCCCRCYCCCRPCVCYCLPKKKTIPDLCWQQPRPYLLTLFFIACGSSLAMQQLNKIQDSNGTEMKRPSIVSTGTLLSTGHNGVITIS